jgi:D-beta-D-heptose 7-phosphate kinase/D-beta-D-heptose 1-phosphate adenosyltransferase
MTVIGSHKVLGQLLIIGDTIVDETWYVNVKKLSPEAPVPVASLVSTEPIRSPGGASLGAAYAQRNKFPFTYLTSVDEVTGKWLESLGINLCCLPAENHISKTRYIDKASNYHLLRVDNDDVVANKPATKDELMVLLSCMPEDTKGIVVLDYRKGIVMDQEACEFIVSYAKSFNIPTYVDTRGNVSKFKGYDFLKFNEKEYVVACTSLSVDNPFSLGKILNVKNLVITKGKKGGELYGIIEETTYSYTPSLRKYNGTPDVTGCGDVFDVNFCYYHFIEGKSPTESLLLSIENATRFAYEPIGERLC